MVNKAWYQLIMQQITRFSADALSLVPIIRMLMSGESPADYFLHVFILKCFHLVQVGLMFTVIGSQFEGLLYDTMI